MSFQVSASIDGATFPGILLLHSNNRYQSFSCPLLHFLSRDGATFTGTSLLNSINRCQPFYDALLKGHIALSHFLSVLNTGESTKNNVA